MRRPVRALLAWRPLDLGNRVFEEAWRIQDHDKIAFWNAMIVAAAKTGGCRYVLTEDPQDGQEIAGVRIVNPFRSPPTLSGEGRARRVADWRLGDRHASEQSVNNFVPTTKEHAGARRLRPSRGSNAGCRSSGRRGTNRWPDTIFVNSNGLLVKLDRRREALEAAWIDFQEHPSTYSYNDLMAHVPRGERSRWHERAVETARAGDDLATLLELLVAKREVAQLADVVRQHDQRALSEITHYVTEPAAKRLTKQYPDAAARLWCALGSRIVNAKKSKYYDLAIEHFARARQCYLRADLGAGWEQVVRQVRADHYRKVGFISEFEHVAAGSGPS